MKYRIAPKLARSANCIALALLLMAVLSQPGCKRSTTAVGPKGGKATVTNNGEDMEIAFKGINGEDVRSTIGRLPPDLPADVAIYPKATVGLTSTTNEVMLVMLKTADSPEAAKTFYDKELKKSGWNIAKAIAMPAGTIQGTKDGRALIVFIAKERDQTAIRLTVTKKAN